MASLAGVGGATFWAPSNAQTPLAAQNSSARRRGGPNGFHNVAHARAAHLAYGPGCWRGAWGWLGAVTWLGGWLRSTSVTSRNPTRGAELRAEQVPSRKKNSLRGWFPPQTPHAPQHPKLRAAGAGRDGSLVGGDAGARAPNPARICATGRYPHLSSPRHLSTPHLPSPLPTPPRFLGNARGSPRRWRLARALSASGAPPRRSRPRGTTVRSTLRCRSPTKPPPFHMPG